MDASHETCSQCPHEEGAGKIAGCKASCTRSIKTPQKGRNYGQSIASEYSAGGRSCVAGFRKRLSLEGVVKMPAQQELRGSTESLLDNRAELAMQRLGPMELLQIALQNNAAIDVIERLAALQEKALARDAEQQFNQAMNQAQSELGRVAPDLTNPQTHSKYASYAALDKIIRPVYSKHGFSLSFDTGEISTPEMVRVLCYVSHRAGHTRNYRVDMPADGKGARGGDVMTKTHATGAAMQYGMRYLLKYIFNVAIGSDDVDGNSTTAFPALAGHLEAITKAETLESLKKLYTVAYKAAHEFGDIPGTKAIIKAKDARRKELVEQHGVALDGE